MFMEILIKDLLLHLQIRRSETSLHYTASHRARKEMNHFLLNKDKINT